MTGRFILGLSGSGFPLTQLAIARLGRGGAALVEVVVGGLLLRDIALIASGAPDRLDRGPAALLYAETAVATVALAAGAVLLADPEVRAARSRGWRVPARELVRRLAVGTLFGIHTMRYRAYLSSGSGRRSPSGSASWARSRTSRQIACCRSGSDSM